MRWHQFPPTLSLYHPCTRIELVDLFVISIVTRPRVLRTISRQPYTLFNHIQSLCIIFLHEHLVSTKQEKIKPTYFHSPHQQSNTLIPVTRLASRISVQPPSAMCTSCEIDPSAKWNCAHISAAGAGQLAIVEFAEGAASANATEMS
jgi:hypothetical protein